MLKLQTDIEGKKAVFGQTRDLLKPYGYVLCGNWDYHRGKFDNMLWREAGETIYLRLPFNVLSGELDHDSALIEFQTPYVIKHIVNLGLDRDENSLLSVTGFNQFQKPIDTDAHIRDKSRWEIAGEQAVNEVLKQITYMTS